MTIFLEIKFLLGIICTCVLKLEWLGCRLAVAFCVRVVRCRQRCVRVWVIVLYVRVQMVVSSLDIS
ncbi:hypothetical protein M6B38_286885 [Iris pallida]|uniref:Uncharacterized protein n=1 Tax=Iris pallida TaxID=29817 RepID=A0AAX6HWK0_IRIPA|nr:hypothetical protein M6B38_286885 [Iris pallida]